MELRFSNKAKALKKAFESGDPEILYRVFDHDSAESIIDALTILQSARNLNDIMPFKHLRPHAMTGPNKGLLSLSLIGRKRMTVRTLDASGNPTAKLDFHSEYGLIVEVSEHYGD